VSGCRRCLDGAAVLAVAPLAFIEVGLAAEDDDVTANGADDVTGFGLTLTTLPKYDETTYDIMLLLLLLL
jgi:hypothetical protein